MLCFLAVRRFLAASCIALLVVVAFLFLGGDNQRRPIELANLEFAREFNVSSVAYSRDGKFLAAGTQRKPLHQQELRDGQVTVWNTATYAQVGLLPQDQWVNSISFSADGNWLAVGSGNYLPKEEKPRGIPGEVKVYECATLTQQAVFELNGDVLAVTFSPDSLLLAAASAGEENKPGEVTVWQVSGWEQRTHLAWFEDRQIAMVFSPDSKTLATENLATEFPGDLLGIIRFCDPAIGQVRSSFKIGYGRMRWLGFSQDGALLVGMGMFGPLRAWDISTRQETDLSRLTGCFGNGNGLAASPDGTRLAMSDFQHGSSNRGSISLWDFRAAQWKLQWSFDRLLINSLAFSPDGKQLAGGGSGLVKVWCLP